MPPLGSLVALHNVTFCYPGRKHPILDKVDFTLHEKQRVGLIGPNGCGKTSLFHIIMGLLRPQTGTVFFKDTQLNRKKDFKILHEKVGLLFQDADDQLFSPTVLEDVAFGPLNLGASPTEARERACQTLQELGLSKLEQRITHQLSGGEKKMVSLATVMVMQPDALLLDEPSNNLDMGTRARLIEILNELDLAILIISHDWSLLADTCEDIYAIDKGKVTQSDKAYLHDHRHAHPYGEQPHRHRNRIKLTSDQKKEER
ncbi:MAG: ABC transporter ATP-binding protein [Candidatus Electrothrix sp. AW1]|nr:ABC transporter ATP-binding protein [Candidatus Electrothrix sp. AX1]MCI5183200.1 ABC transporter ATP-binding protein [Candidatus Electrothrix gigas]